MVIHQLEARTDLLISYLNLHDLDLNTNFNREGYYSSFFIIYIHSHLPVSPIMQFGTC